jgi:hypothetical protein
VLTTQHSLSAKVGTSSPAAAVDQPIYFTCGLKATEFFIVVVVVVKFSPASVARVQAVP